MMKDKTLFSVLNNNSKNFAPIMDFNFSLEGVHIDLSINNRELQELTPNTPETWKKYIWDYMKSKSKKVCFGGYLEERTFYLNSELFTSDGDPRIIHIGLDIWAEVGTPLMAPLDGDIHSFNYNKEYLDYGYTIILKHELEGLSFHTLYGHLSMNSIENKKVGDKINRSEIFATLGDLNENGNWPPHLHFQIIIDMENKTGDYPGLCSKSTIEKYKMNCPDPTVMLGL